MTKEVQKRSDYPKPKKSKESKHNLLDSFMYWFVQIAFAILSAAALYSYSKPVDPVLAVPVATAFVAFMFYISLRNR